jgi:hypothetical protein
MDALTVAERGEVSNRLQSDTGERAHIPKSCRTEYTYLEMKFQVLNVINTCLRAARARQVPRARRSPYMATFLPQRAAAAHDVDHVLMAKRHTPC